MTHDLRCRACFVEICQSAHGRVHHGKAAQTDSPLKSKHFGRLSAKGVLHARVFRRVTTVDWQTNCEWRRFEWAVECSRVSAPNRPRVTRRYTKAVKVFPKARVTALCCSRQKDVDHNKLRIQECGFGNHGRARQDTMVFADPRQHLRVCSASHIPPVGSPIDQKGMHR